MIDRIPDDQLVLTALSDIVLIGLGVVLLFAAWLVIS